MTGPRERLAGGVAAALVAGAAVAALVRTAGSSAAGRSGGAFAAGVLGCIAYGALRGRGWSLGTAFFIGLLWMWAAVALALQGRLGYAPALGWIAWAALLMAACVKARTGAGADLHAPR